MLACSPMSASDRQRIVPYEIGCQPSASVPAELLLQDDRRAFLLFFAVSNEVSPSGFLEDLGVAVLECVGCAATKFAYPNDEGLPEHPLYRFGLHDLDRWVLEVVDSVWAQEVESQMRATAARIWGKDRTSDRPSVRHFLIPLKEWTFECLALELVVRYYGKDYRDALRYAHERLFGSNFAL